MDDNFFEEPRSRGAKEPEVRSTGVLEEKYNGGSVGFFVAPQLDSQPLNS
jgi:hypothetical protein